MLDARGMQSTPASASPLQGHPAPRVDAWADYRSDIDGLRATAVLAVVLHHFWPALLPGGYVGVDVFFVISGYLITRIIGREIAQERFSFARFYERRARRLFPALFAMLAATALAGYAIMLPGDFANTLRALLGTLSFSANLVFWRSGSDYFGATDARINPLLHTWSLAVEEQFYLLFPVLLILCHRFVRRSTVLVLALCAAASLAAAVLLVRPNPTAAFYLTPFRGWELLAGCLLAVGAVPPVRQRWLRESMVAAGLAAIAGSSLAYDESTLFPGLSALAPVLGAAAIIHAGSSGPSTLGQVLLQRRSMVYLGLISYSLYLWHWPVFVLARYAGGFELPPWQQPVWLAASLLIASLSYHLIEQPWRRPLPQARTRRPLVIASVAALGLLAFGGLGLWKDGYAGRFAPQVVSLDRARHDPVQFRPCAGRPLDQACVLGAPEVRPEVLLWGDSHLLAWAPALDGVLRQQGRSALVASMTGCPPLLDVSSRSKLACTGFSQGVREYLQAGNGIRTVVVAGFWSTYLREHGPLRSLAPNPAPAGLPAAAQALEHTLAWLDDAGLRTVVLGPVPTYDKSVPAALAFEAAQGRTVLDRSPALQLQRNQAFFSVVQRLRDRGGITVIDALPWLCDEACRVLHEGVSLYRDSNHLSQAGARLLQPELAAALLVADGDGDGSEPTDGR